MSNGMIIMGMTGGADTDGSKGDHIILSAAYNITKEEIETIAKLFIRTVLDEYNVH